MFLHADCEDSDQTGRTTLIRVFAGRKGHFVGFVMWQLISALLLLVSLLTFNLVSKITSLALVGIRS